MLLTVAEFRARVNRDLSSLIRELQEQTGRRGEDEAAAWVNSLAAVSRAFSAPIFQLLHLYFGERGHVSLEYRLPASSSWCDLVLLGSHDGEPAAAILELKHWDTWSDKPGAIEGLIDHHGESTLHPSDQVRGYVDYCRNFHSAVLAERAKVHGCVMFTKDERLDAYHRPPNEKLAQDFPCFAVTDSPRDKGLVEYFASRLSEPDSRFAEKFEIGHYEQDRSFVVGIAGILARSTKKGLVLLDNQRFGFALCLAEIDKAVFQSDARKTKKVIIVEGPPGSGKSAIAAKVWADLAADSRFKRGRFVLTTTSTSQETNWQHLVQIVTGVRGAEGIVLPANRYAPEQLHRLNWWKRERPGKLKPPAKWRDNLMTLNAEHGGFWMPNDHLDVSVVDEAHALINPEVPRAITHSGWPNPFGPQAYHIIRASRVSVFFLDPEQRFRDRETTTVSDIERWAAELGAEVVSRVSLKGAQFRCAGSTEYVTWVEAFLAGEPAQRCAELGHQWTSPSGVRTRRAAEPEAPNFASSLAEAVRRPRPSFEFQLCKSPAELEASLRSRLVGNATGRLVASFARPWKTEDISKPHDLPADEQDFVFRWNEKGREQVWARPWNVIPHNDYSHFIQAAPGSRIAKDPLSEVGCTYAVRGFDFDYVGLLWLNDLRWSGHQWYVDFDHVFETGLRGTLKSATRKNNPDAEARKEILARVKQAYRILLTRAIKGVFLYCEDPATRDHLRAALGEETAPYRISPGKASVI